MVHKIFIAALILFCPFCQRAQTVFWTETFNNGCTSNCTSFAGTAGNGAWTFSNNGSNGPTPNKWFVSCAENGMPVGSCGAGCGSNATMHISSDPNSDCGCLLCPTGDCGAAYDACSGFNFCFNSPLANKRAISPLISTAGKSGISVSFDYIENGDGANDDGLAYYSTNGGTTWVLLVNTNKTATGCGGQGIWANYTSGTLPVACDNNANFRLSFVWINNADDVGNDPSYAINDLKVRYTTLLPVTLSKFSASQIGGGVLLEWQTESEKNFSHFEIQKSEDAINFSVIGEVGAYGNRQGEKKYEFADPDYNHGLNYYRLKIIDVDSSYTFSEIVAVDESNTLSEQSDYFLNDNGEIEVGETFAKSHHLQFAKIFDLSGKLICSRNIEGSGEKGNFIFSCSELKNGLYLCQLAGEGFQKNFKFLIAR